MVHSTRIALLGFGRIEHAAFEAFFRVAGRRCPAYEQEADFRAADFVIVDAADAAARSAVLEAGLVGRAVVLGVPALRGALLQMARPLNLMQVVRALDAVLADAPDAQRDTVREGHVVAEDGAADGPATAAGDAPDTVRDAEHDAGHDTERDTERDAAHDTEPDAALASGRDAAPSPASGAARAAAGAAPGDSAPDTETRPPDAEVAGPGGDRPAGAGVTARPVIAFVERRRRPRGAPMEHILVVDDSDVALRFMATHLQRFGFQIHLARSGEEALRRVAERRFEFVFLDVRMEGLDGFQTCKAIKRADYPPGQTPPTVVMLTCLAGAADRLRGTMAGADAYLVKPLRERELLKVVGEREIARHAYAETAAVSTMR
jgi:CheY-like chemotaxis protein